MNILKPALIAAVNAAIASMISGDPLWRRRGSNGAAERLAVRQAPLSLGEFIKPENGGRGWD